METIEVQDPFSLEDSGATKERGSSAQAAVARGEGEQQRIQAIAQQERETLWSSTSGSLGRLPNPRPAPPRGEEIPEDERAAHQRLVITLSRWGSSKRFAEYLKSMAFNLNVGHLKKCSVQELEDMLERVRITAHNKSINSMLEDTVFGALQFGEIAVANSPLGDRLLIKGLTQALRADDTFLDCVEAISLDYGSLTNVGPEMRALYAVISAVGKCHGINTFVRRQREILAEQEAEGDAAAEAPGAEPEQEPDQPAPTDPIPDEVRVSDDDDE